MRYNLIKKTIQMNTRNHISAILFMAGVLMSGLSAAQELPRLSADGSDMIAQRSSSQSSSRNGSTSSSRNSSTSSSNSSSKSSNTNSASQSEPAKSSSKNNSSSYTRSGRSSTGSSSKSGRSKYSAHAQSNNRRTSASTVRNSKPASEPQPAPGPAHHAGHQAPPPPAPVVYEEVYYDTPSTTTVVMSSSAPTTEPVAAEPYEEGVKEPVRKCHAIATIGFNICGIEADFDNPDLSYGVVRGGYNFGLKGEFPFPLFGREFGYCSIGAQFNRSNFHIDFDDYNVFKYRDYTLDVPLMFGWRYQESEGGCGIALGPIFSYGLHGRRYEKVDDPYTIVDEESGEWLHYVERSDVYEDFDNMRNFHCWLGVEAWAAFWKFYFCYTFAANWSDNHISPNFDYFYVPGSEWRRRHSFAFGVRF